MPVRYDKRFHPGREKGRSAQNEKTPRKHAGHILQKTNSALAELRSFPGSLQAVLLAFLHTRVTGQESGFLQRGSQIRIRFAQSAADSVANSAGLTGQASTVHIDHHIKTGSAGQNQGLPNGHLQSLKSEILINITFIDHYFSVTGNKTDAGNGLLAAADSAVIYFSHVLLLLSASLQVQHFRLLSSLFILVSGINLQFPCHLPAERSLREHTGHGMPHGELGLFSEKLAVFGLFQSADISAVMIVNLLIKLFAGQDDLICVDDNHKVSRICIGSINGLVLAAKNVRDLAGKAAQNQTFRIDNIPFAGDVTGLRYKRLQGFSSSKWVLIGAPHVMVARLERFQELPGLAELLMPSLIILEKYSKVKLFLFCCKDNIALIKYPLFMKGEE